MRSTVAIKQDKTRVINLVELKARELQSQYEMTKVATQAAIKRKNSQIVPLQRRREMDAPAYVLPIGVHSNQAPRPS